MTTDEAREALLEALRGNRDAPVLDRLNDFEAAVDANARAEAYRQGYDSAVYDHEAKLAALREAVMALPGYQVATSGDGYTTEYYVERRAVLAALAATPAETFWLVERGQPEGQVPTVWWGHSGWWETVAEAERYPTREAAQAVVERQFTPPPSRGGPIARAVEHSWLAATPAEEEGTPYDDVGDPHEH